MKRDRIIMHLLSMVLVVVIGGCLAFPSEDTYDDQKFEADIRRLVDLYYKDEVPNDFSSSLEDMQADQPTTPSSTTENTLSDDPVTEEPEYLQRRHRARDQWRDHIMFHLLSYMGRLNSTVPANVNVEKININNVIHNFENTTAVRQLAESLTSEKFRSFYPSCEVPKNTDVDLWKDNNELNLFFNLDNLEGNIASMTIRLYSALAGQNGTGATSTEKSNSDESNGEDEKTYTVSALYYTKTLRKNKVKRRACDTVMVSESFNWVELNLKRAIRAWSKGKNLGIAILVEDQEKRYVRPETIIKGPACTVGSSTPKPIPTVLLDSARAHELFGNNRLDGGNSTASAALDRPVLPTLDICTIDWPVMKGKIGKRVCSLKKSVNVDEPKRVGRMAASLTMPSARHIRHQKQHLTDKTRQAEDPNDPRSHIIKQQVILTSDQLQNFNGDNFNLTDINR